MAIDDNTTYGLTGAQVKELPGKINAVKGMAKVLTTDDYNWPTTGTKNSIAAWKLNDGFYSTGDVAPNSILLSSSAYASSVGGGGLILVGSFEKSSTLWKTIVYISNSGYGKCNVYSMISKASDGSAMTNQSNVASMSGLLRIASLANNLTTTDSYLALDARQGKTLKDLVDSLAIRGAGAPTTATVGQVGTLYEDTTNGDLYICTDATNPYVWEAVGGGGGPTVVQTTGNSTTNVMSQDATTKLVYSGLGNSAGKAINIGTNIVSSQTDAIAIGYASNVAAERGIAIGRGAVAGAKAAIALGMFSNASTAGEMNIGSSNTAYGYNSSNYRLLSGVYDPQSAHDAATKGYVDGMITMTDTDPGEGAALAAGKFIAVYDSNS